MPKRQSIKIYIYIYLIIYSNKGYVTIMPIQTIEANTYDRNQYDDAYIDNRDYKDSNIYLNRNCMLDDNAD